MDTKPTPFVPPAPVPRSTPPSLFELIRIVYRNPLELWGEPSYNEPWISVSGAGGPLVIANDPGLIRHVLVDNAKNYKLATVRQKILRPILRDGLLTAEGTVWRRSRKAMAPIFTPRHIFGFAGPMLKRTEAFAERYDEVLGGTVDVVARHDDADLRDPRRDAVFRRDRRPGRRIRAPDRPAVRDHGPRRSARPVARARLAAAHHALARPQDHGLLPQHRRRNDGHAQRQRMARDPDGAPEDFLTLLLQRRGPGRADLAARSPTTSSPSSAPATRPPHGRSAGPSTCSPRRRGSASRVEAEIDAVLSREPDPVKWLDMMPFTRAAFEEALRLYPPAPSINREPIENDRYQDFDIRKGAQVLVMPWTVHRHRKLWDNPDAFMPGALPSRATATRSTATSICRSAPARASASA